MGVKNLFTFVTKNIKLQNSTWTINRGEFKRISTMENGPYNFKNNQNLNLIVDANSFFYSLSRQINWFIFDYIFFFKLLQKYIFQLLAINNLERLVFVYDGIDTEIKIETNIKHTTDRAKSMKDLYKKIIESSKQSKRGFFKPRKPCPVPLLKMAYVRYLFDLAKHNKKFEIKLSLFEADADIAALAIKYNGYVISNDSDFYIYDVPGYINIESIVFPKNYNDNNIKYQLYRKELLIDHLGIPKEFLPIFATLCGNDYISFNNYPKFMNQINNYRCIHEGTEKIENIHFRRIVNFILDIHDSIKDECDKTNDSNAKQELLIKHLFKMKEKDVKEEKCQKKIMESINEYNLKNLKEKEAKEISKEILKNYQSARINDTLLNAIYIHYFKCTPYLENPNKKYCWGISESLRKIAYDLLFKRNIKDFNKDQDGNDVQTNYSITEYVNENGRIVHKEINFNIDLNDPYPNSLNDRFELYLTVFKSNRDRIKKLPYYLIPVVSSLRYYLLKKCNDNLFIPKEDDPIYTKFLKSNNIQIKARASDLSDLIDDTILHYYDFQALLASCVAALTFTYLHNSVYKQNSKKIVSSNCDIDEIINKISSLSLSSSSIKENIKENLMNCHNIYDMSVHHKNRSLSLKKPWTTKFIQTHREDFDNGLQVYAEFLNILNWNSQLMQILNFTEEVEEFGLLYTMYHYIWEEAFYSIIDMAKNNDITQIFNTLFKVWGEQNNSGEYINYLRNCYSTMLNAILS